MKFYWTIEDTFPGWALRDQRGQTRGIVAQNPRGMYHGQIFQPDLPVSQDFKLALHAAWWVMNNLRQIENMEPASFGDFPP